MTKDETVASLKKSIANLQGIASTYEGRRDCSSIETCVAIGEDIYHMEKELTDVTSTPADDPRFFEEVEPEYHDDDIPF